MIDNIDGITIISRENIKHLYVCKQKPVLPLNTVMSHKHIKPAIQMYVFRTWAFEKNPKDIYYLNLNNLRKSYIRSVIITKSIPACVSNPSHNYIRESSADIINSAFAICDNASALYRSDLGTVDIFNAAEKSL